jgi:hypothetical protein
MVQIGSCGHNFRRHDQANQPTFATIQKRNPARISRTLKTAPVMESDENR